jgi:hypothetical protein
MFFPHGCRISFRKSFKHCLGSQLQQATFYNIFQNKTKDLGMRRVLNWILNSVSEANFIIYVQLRLCY